MSNVLQGHFQTTLPLDPDTLLENNKGAFKTLVLIGYDKDGHLIVASSDADIALCNFICDQAKQAFLGMA